MKFTGILFAYFGYVLVYASTAAGGKFATEPWATLFADAYTDANPPSKSDTPMTNQDWATTASKTLGVGTFTPLSPSPPKTFSRPRITLPQTTPYSRAADAFTG